MLKFITLFLLFFILTGCVAPRQIPLPVDATKQQALLSEMDNWQISGKLAVKSAKEKMSANLNWQQNQETFYLRLNSFIGITLMSMKGNAQFAQLEADNQTYTDTSPSRLLYQVTGRNIPIEQLIYWIKGQKTLGTVGTYSEHGLLTSLFHPQLGWKVTYDKYKLLQGRWLPHRIQLELPQYQVKIRISGWKIK